MRDSDAFFFCCVISPLKPVLLVLTGTLLLLIPLDASSSPQFFPSRDTDDKYELLNRHPRPI